MTTASTFVIYPDPGPLPTLPPPRLGEVVEMMVEGLPPRKDTSFSIRNIKHSHYQLFLTLRKKGIEAMNGRAWFIGAVDMEFVLHAPCLEKDLLGYESGIMDTLDGSHGLTFTYLPVVYQDDAQIVNARCRFVESTNTYYTLKFRTLESEE